MRILIINSVETAKNGITNVIFNHLKEFNGSEMIFDMVVINELDEDYKYLIESYCDKYFVLSRSKRTLVRYIINLIKVIKQNSYDAIHIHGNSHTLVLELIAAQIGGCKVRIVHAHNTSCGSYWLHQRLSRVFHSLCNHRLACGIEAGKFMHEDQKFEIINNGIDVKKFSFDITKRQYIREKHNLKETTVLGHIGMFNEAKNQSFLLDIIKELIITHPNYKLLLIGNGVLIEKVKEQVKMLNIQEQVVFVGETTDVSSYLSAMDLFLMPSLYEGLPLTLVEAQVNGLTCICSDRITEEVNLTGKVFFLPIDEGSTPWVKKILGYNTKFDRSYASKDAMNCIIEQGYSISEESKKLHKYYYEAVNNIKK